MLFVLTAAFGIQRAVAFASEAPTPFPNLVLIMADDLGFSDLGCYGSEIQTPNLDRLAAEGLRFTQFYNNGKCIPTRASLLTGLYPRGVKPALTASMVTLPEVLRQAGYQTSLSGKWHLGSKAPARPIDRGFDEFYGLMDGCCNYFDPARRDPEFEGGRFRTFGHNDQLITKFPENFYTTDAFTDHAITTLQRFAATGKPFFLHICYTCPHSPIHARPEDIAKYQDRYRAGWEALRRERYARQVQMKLLDPKWKLPGKDPEAYDWERSDQAWEAQRMAVYAAMVDRMDQNIGRLLVKLKELRLETNTVVMFLSDNGSSSEEAGGRMTSETPGPKESYMNVGPGWAWAHNTPFRRYKTWMHEGGLATPLIVRWPGVVQPGTLTSQVGHILDLLPTCLDAASATYPAGFRGHPILPAEGRSLLPILKGGQRPAPGVLFWEEQGNRAVRQGKWKLVWDTTVARWELYDLEADRTELYDLSAKLPEKVKELATAWENWDRATGRTLGPAPKGKGKTLRASQP